MTIIQDTDDATEYVLLDLYQPPTAHRAEFTTALDNVINKVATLIPQFGLRNPRISRPDTLLYEFCTADEWVASFWCGQLWLAHSITGQEQFKNSATMRNPYFKNILEHPEWHDHDLGFLFSLSSVAQYKLTGDPTARATSIRAAELLAARWRQPLPFVMCWNPMKRDEPEFAQRKVGTLNIDSVQGMALLLWAAEETGQSSFADIAHMHLDSCRTQLLRDDFSSYHCREFDTKTGLPLEGYTHQGYSDESCWSRGHSWMIHGFAQSYLTTRDQIYRETSAKMADYIADKLPEDGVPYWDYNLPDGYKPYRDTSAAAVTAAGLYALAQGFGPGTESEKYTALADKMLLGLVKHYDITANPGSQGLIDQGAAFVEAGRANNMLPYGDYYYMEALMRSVGHTEFFW